MKKLSLISSHFSESNTSQLRAFFAPKQAAEVTPYMEYKNALWMFLRNLAVEEVPGLTEERRLDLLNVVVSALRAPDLRGTSKIGNYITLTDDSVAGTYYRIILFDLLWEEHEGFAYPFEVKKESVV